MTNDRPESRLAALFRRLRRKRAAQDVTITAKLDEAAQLRVLAAISVPLKPLNPDLPYDREPTAQDD